MTDVPSAKSQRPNRFALGPNDYLAARRAGVALFAYAVVYLVKLPYMWVIAPPAKTQGWDAAAGEAFMLAWVILTAVLAWKLCMGAWITFGLGYTAIIAFITSGGFVLNCRMAYADHPPMAVIDAALVALMWTALIFLLPTRRPRSVPPPTSPPADDNSHA